MNSYDEVERPTESGDATPDVYAYLADGKPTLLCGPCARKRKRVSLASVADELYRDDSRCADCAPEEKNDGRL